MRKRLLGTILAAVLCVAIGASACFFGACGIASSGGDDTENNQETPDTSSGEAVKRDVTDADIAAIKSAVEAVEEYKESFTLIATTYSAGVNYNDPTDYVTVTFDAVSGNLVYSAVVGSNKHAMYFVFDEDGTEYAVYMDSGEYNKYVIDGEAAENYYDMYMRETDLPDNFLFTLPDLTDVSTPEALEESMLDFSYYWFFYKSSSTILDTISITDYSTTEDGDTIVVTLAYSFSDEYEDEEYGYVHDIAYILSVKDGKIVGVSISWTKYNAEDNSFYSSIQTTTEISYEYDSSMMPESFDDFTSTSATD